MADDLCTGFEPQNYLKDRCKKCFRIRTKHGTSATPKRTSWRDKVYGANQESTDSEKQNGTNVKNSTPTNEPSLAKIVKSDARIKNVDKTVRLVKEESDSGSEPDVTVTLRLPISKSKASTVVTSKPPTPTDMDRNSNMTSRRSDDELSFKSARSNNGVPTSPTNSRRSRRTEDDEMSFKSLKSDKTNMSAATSCESIPSDARSMATAFSGSTKGSDRSSTPTENLAEDDSRAFMRSIKAQLEIMENKCARLEKQNATMRESELSLATLETLPLSSSERIAQLEEKLTLAESLCQDYRDENTVLKCELRELQEAVSRDSTTEMKQHQDKLKAAETLCEELMDENDSLKMEVRDLQTEIEELQDQYREEEIDEFRVLQQELEYTAKNCRILQFKLRKAERVKEQSEADRQHLEEQLKEMIGQAGSTPEIVDSRRIKELESELRIAKEVSVRLHNELEALEDKRYKLEDENFYLKEKIREVETREKLMESSRQKYEQIKKFGKENPTPSSSHSEYNVPQLLRDLQDALERETDMRDQLKFAEEDVQSLRKKLSDLETENEGLLKQLAKLTSPGPRGSNRPPMIRSASEGQTQIQLELAEHEATSLKNKLDRMEKEHDKMLSKISLLENELKKVGGKTEFTEAEINLIVPDTYYKQKIKMLEEEVEELRNKMDQHKSDEDLTAGGTWRMGRARPARVIKSRSLDIPDSQPTEMDFKKQLALAEQENSMLRQRVSEMELKSERIHEENKKLQVIQKSKLGGGGVEKEFRDKTEQMQKDIDRFVSRIADLERQKGTMAKEVERLKKVEMVKKLGAADDSDSESKTKSLEQQLKNKLEDMTRENKEITSDLRLEKQNNKRLEQQLNDYRQIIGQSESQKLVLMASKVEVVNNQLKESEEKFALLHRRLIGGNGNTKYEDALKERLEKLERDLSEERAKNSRIIAQKPTEVEGLAPELDKCYDTLVTVESQVERIYKQLETLESGQKMETSRPLERPTRFQRSVSLRKDGKTEILSDVARVKAELESLMSHLQRKKTTNGNIDSQVSSDRKAANSPAKQLDDTPLKEKCVRQEKVINDLREQLQLAKHDKDTAEQKCNVATERLLQTEERWNKELEKLRESYENQVKDLKYYLKEAERSKDEKSSLLTECTNTLNDKTKRVNELEQKVSRLQDDLKNKYRDLQDKMEVEHKRAKEFETKYQKLEELYESDQQKLNTDRDKLKSEISDFKKRYDDAQEDMEKMRKSREKQEQEWGRERKDLESKISKLEAHQSEVEQRMSQKAAETASAQTKKLMAEVNELKSKYEKDIEQAKKEKQELQNQVDQKTEALEKRTEDESKLKREVELLKERVEEQKTQLQETRNVRDTSREELSRWQQTWARERSDLAHKLRQEEKIQQAEIQALRLKFESRIKIMEDTTKTLHAQLAQARRERDNHRDSLLSSEKKLAELKQKMQDTDTAMILRLSNAEEKLEEYDDLKTQLQRLQQENKTMSQNYETDIQMWAIEKKELNSKLPEAKKESATKPGTIRSGRFDRPELSPLKKKQQEKDISADTDRVADAMKIAEKLRKQIDEMQNNHTKEVEKLREQIDRSRKTHSKEDSDLKRKVRELQEEIKVVEIDRRNFLSSRGNLEAEKTALLRERDAQMQKLHDTEIHQLANKYKLDKVADLIIDLEARVRYSSTEDAEKKEIEHGLQQTLEKLESVREDMAKTRELGKILDGDTVSVSSFKSVGSTFSRKNFTDIDKALPRTDQRPVPIGSEAEPPTHSKNGSLSATATPRTQRKDGPGEVNSSQIFKSSSSSACSEVTIHNWEQRITEIRLRSPSPSPRKMTNYPEAPPSIILSKEKSVEYDKDGKRHWIPNTMQRSISHDPRTSMSLATPDDASSLASGISSATDSEVIKSHNRSQSSGTGKMLRAQVSTESAESQPAPHTEQTGRFANIFGTLGRSGGHVNEKRKFFSLRKSKSVETSSTARNLAGVGMQAMSPGVSPSVLPDSLQSSVGSGINVDIGSSEQIHTSRGKKLVERLRRFRSRSRSKEPTASIQNLPAKTDTALSAPSTPVIPATTISDSSRSKPSVSTVGRTWSTESESRRYYPYTASTSSSSYFRRYGSRRSLSSRFFSRS